MTTYTKLTPEEQDAVLYWPCRSHIPIIPCESKSKKVHLIDWQKLNLDAIDYSKNLNDGIYDNGIAARLGPTLPVSNDGNGGITRLYSAAIDFDKEEGVKAWFGSWGHVIEASKRTRIEWHKDKAKIHSIFLTRRPLANRRIPKLGIEIRCENQLLFVSPSINKDGNPWTILGTDQILIHDESELIKLEAQIESISQGYMSDERKARYIRWLEEPGRMLGEGEGRHPGLVVLGTSYYYRYSGEWRGMTDEERRAKLWEWNRRVCHPIKPDNEFDAIWKWIVEHHRKNRDEQHEKLENERRDSFFGGLDTIPGCVVYQINSKPDRFVLGTPDNRLVEIERKWSENKQNPGSMVSRLVYNRTFIACKPIRIIKHTNPLSFMEIPQKYTVEFRGSEDSGNFTVKHKTLSEIATELKQSNALCENGLDVALIAQIKGFEKFGLLTIDDDIDYIGFFPEGSNRLIACGFELKQEEIDVRDSLKYINELAKYFEGRLDLLSHTIQWAIIAPCSFIFKVVKAPVLEWLEFYGSPNASKSTLGRVVLGIDGHANDGNYNVNISHVDTIARLGDTIGKTTFPILVDEMDFTDNKYLVNQVKSAIDQPRLRKVLDRSRRVEHIAALSPLIMTSNPPPPLNDAAFMKRVTARYFPAKETRYKDEQCAKDFDALLSQLDRLQPLGCFRNRFIMNNQAIILDRKLTPLEKARKILKHAYESADMLMPGWFRRQLEQNQLKESIVDSKEAVLDAFENLIIDKTKSLKGIQDLIKYKNSSDRFVNLVNGKLLPFAKIITDKAHKPTDRIAIYTGILKELYEYGVTTEQLSNLKALADYMCAKHHQSHGKNVVEISIGQLEDYFGEEQGEQGEQGERLYTKRSEDSQ